MKMSLLIVLLALAGLSPAIAETDYAKREQYNPQRDPDVERGYRENQEYNRERRSEEIRRERGEAPWSVDTSGQDSKAGKRDK